MNKKTIIIISIAVAVILAAVILILTLGGKSENNNSSDIDTNSNEIVSSTDESSADSETSSKKNVSTDTSSDVSSSQTSTPSKTENTAAPTTSTNKTESKNETTSTPTTAPATPKNYLEKIGLKVITLNDDYCLNAETHECVKVSCDIQETAVNEYVWTEISENERNNYTCVNAVFNGYCGTRSVIAFDKYTGNVLQVSNAQNAKHFSVNGKEIRAWQTWGGGGDWYITCDTLIPKDYDGLMFLITTENIEYSSLSNKTLLLDEVCDLKNSKYYVFSGKN